MTDAQRIDWLETEMKREPLVLHDLLNLRPAIGWNTNYRGLGLLQGGRTLRDAIDSAAGARSAIYATENP